MILSPLHEVKNASKEQTILRGANVDVQCEDYLMITFDLSQGVVFIYKYYPDAESAKNAPQCICVEDNGGEHHFEQCSHSDTVVIWKKA